MTLPAIMGGMTACDTCGEAAPVRVLRDLPFREVICARCYTSAAYEAEQCGGAQVAPEWDDLEPICARVADRYVREMGVPEPRFFDGGRK